MVNWSMSDGHFPEDLKLASLRATIKGPNLCVEELKNYRPISNLQFISKVMEKCVCQQFVKHLKDNNLQDIYQSAYRENSSVETAMLKIYNDALRSLDNGRSMLIIMLDLSAAFDTVDHGRLLHTLKTLIGLDDIVLRWFASYLKGRKQEVCIENSVSTPKHLMYGVPQGSILGPVLFSTYMIPLSRMLKDTGCSYHMYADDVQIYISLGQEEDDDDVNTLEKCVAMVNQWMTENFLQLNASKTEAVLVAKCPAKLQLNICGKEIQTTNSVKSLGVILDSKLTLETHVNNVCRGAYYHLRNIARIRKCLDTSTLRLVVHSLVTTRLDFSNGILIGLPQRLIDKMQKVQNSAARLILNKRKFEHVTPLLKQLHWLPIRERIKYKIIYLTFKSLKGQSPQYLADMLKSYTPVRKLRSSSKNLLQIPNVKLKMTERAFSVAAPILWNSISDELRQITSTDNFRRQLKTYLFKEAFK